MMFPFHGRLRSVVQGIAVGQIPELPAQSRVAVNAVECSQGMAAVDILLLRLQGDSSPDQVFLNPWLKHAQTVDGPLAVKPISFQRRATEVLRDVSYLRSRLPRRSRAAS